MFPYFESVVSDLGIVLTFVIATGLVIVAIAMAFKGIELAKYVIWEAESRAQADRDYHAREAEFERDERNR